MKPIELWAIQAYGRNYRLVALQSNYSFELYLNGEFLQTIQTAEQLVVRAREIKEQLERGIPANCLVSINQEQEDQYDILFVNRRQGADWGRVMKNGKVATDVMRWADCQAYVQYMKEGKK